MQGRVFEEKTTMVQKGFTGLIVLFVQMVALATPSAQELLGKFTETVDKAHTSFITQSKVDTISYHKYSGEWAHLSGKKERYCVIEFRTDGKRVKLIRQAATDPVKEKSYRSDTYDGDKRYQFLGFKGPQAKFPGSLILDVKSPGKSFEIDSMLAYEDALSKSFGYLNGDIERFDRILQDAEPGQISVKEKMEDINGTAHYVIEAETKSGSYRIWLNPEKGYNFSKAILVKKPGDYLMGKKDNVLPGCTMRFVIENQEFRQVDGVWVPAKATAKMNDTFPDNGHVKINMEIELISMLINPDHDALDSFSIDDIKEGSLTVIEGVPGDFRWNNGKAVELFHN